MTKTNIEITDNGTLHLIGLDLQIPEGWEATETPGVYACKLPACKYRRFSYRAEQGRLVVQLHCFLKKGNCTVEQCRSCGLATPDTGVMKEVEVERDLGNGTVATSRETLKVDETPDPNLIGLRQSNWRVPKGNTKPQPAQEPEPKSGGPTHGRPRILADGTMAYPKRGWEPPPVPNGYKRKSDNLRSSDAWVFLPVLSPCEHREPIITYSACGAAKVRYHCRLTADMARCQDCREGR